MKVLVFLSFAVGDGNSNTLYGLYVFEVQRTTGNVFSHMQVRSLIIG